MWPLAAPHYDPYPQWPYRPFDEDYSRYLRYCEERHEERIARTEWSRAGYRPLAAPRTAKAASNGTTDDSRVTKESLRALKTVHGTDA